MISLHYSGAVEVFPTSVFYLQMHYKKWKRNQQVKDCVYIMVADAAHIDILNFTSLRNTKHEEAKGQDERNVADVQWPVDNAIRPGFQILADSVVAGRTYEEPMIFGTTAVDRQSTLDLRPITKQSIGGARRTRLTGTSSAAIAACCILVISLICLEEEPHSGEKKKMVSVLQNEWGSN
jgi:hypothetical protein